jgi:kumamolisin
MPDNANFRALPGSVHDHPAEHAVVGPTPETDEVTVTIFVRRKPGHAAAEVKDAGADPKARPSHAAFTAARGADEQELHAVARYAIQAGLEILDIDPARRTVVARGTAAAINKAFNTELKQYKAGAQAYRSHDGEIGVPADIADYVEAVVGLTNRPPPAKHFAKAPAKAQKPAKKKADPPGAHSLMPAEVAALYNFPPGDGSGQTVGIYEMTTQEGPPGYDPQDVAKTMAAMGGLPVPRVQDVAIDGVGNSGTTDPETLLDISIVGAIAPAAQIVVYFCGETTQNMLHSLQAMIHPKPGQPQPSILSISYGWGADDTNLPYYTPAEWQQFAQLFEDAQTKKITVLVSSGDSGAQAEDRHQAQVTYPATDPLVTACGGTTIGAVSGSSFDEWVWNDSWPGGKGATGGGISARFAPPAYQSNVALPKRNTTGAAGRGVPDIAGNASPVSGYPQQLASQAGPGAGGGTSAVAPLYAGLIARINANNGHPSGFLNPVLYSLPASAFHDVTASPGAANNSFGGVTGYPVAKGWDACTGLGSVNGQALQAALK